MQKNVTVELTPFEVALVATLVGTTNFSVSKERARPLYDKMMNILGQDTPISPITLTLYQTVTSWTVRIEQLVAKSKLAPFDPFKGLKLPKNVVYFEYPEHGTGKPVARYIKVEDEDNDYLKGYVVHAKAGVMTFDFKNFSKAKITNLIRQA